MTETIRARPTVYNGIRMRSRLEADYAAYLDSQGHLWEYEPECFASPEGQWLPDFRVTFPARTEPATLDPVQLVELKPAGRLDADYMGLDGGSIDKHLTRMAVAWASAPKVSLMLVYWQYGGPAVMIIDAACKGAPWLAHGGPLPLLWTGMGQYTRCENQHAPC